MGRFRQGCAPQGPGRVRPGLRPILLRSGASWEPDVEASTTRVSRKIKRLLGPASGVWARALPPAAPRLGQHLDAKIRCDTLPTKDNPWLPMICTVLGVS